MPIILGLASSHAPSMFVAADKWPKVHASLVRDVPPPHQLAQETPDVIERYVERINIGFATLRAQIEAAKPDAIIVIGDDQNELFSNAIIPSFAIFVGDAVEGSYGIAMAGEGLKDHWMVLPCHSAIATIILEGLMKRDFDLGFSEKLVPLARPEGGIGHAFTRISHVMGLAESSTPIVPIFVNAYHPPLPSAARCYALGQAIADIFADRPERVAIYGSGGLSHDPRGPRAGWIDEPLDRWVLDRIATGEGDRLSSLFEPDSATYHGGTGEIRSWITVAGACEGVKATVVDYIPAYLSVVGLGFAYWKQAG